MPTSGEKPKHKKPVTLDGYRRDRDFWKRKSLKQQRALDDIQNRHDALVESTAALRASRDYFRYHMRELCPHDRTNTKNLVNQTYCERCQQLFDETPRM